MSNQLSFEANDKILRDVLFAHRKYSVPRYQRPYTWDIEEVSEFWEDLHPSSEPYFLGSLIFNSEPEEQTGYADIIDGQQRLLTITLFMAVLRDLAKEIDDDLAQRIQRRDILYEGWDGQFSPRLLPSDTLRKYFNSYIQSGEDNILQSSPKTREESRVQRSYEYLWDKVRAELARSEIREEQQRTLNDLRKKVSKLIVIDVEITREEDAYEIFETTNARGVDLSVSDLLKNLIFKKIPARSDRDVAKEIWQEITDHVEATNTEMKRFIRYFWISRRNFITEKKVYREIKRNITNWNELLSDLWDDAGLYNRLLEGSKSEFQDLKHDDRIYKSVFALRLMRVSQCYVLLLCILRNYKSLGTDPSRYIELVENFTFQYSVVCKLPGNRVEKIYSRFALEIEKAVQEVTKKRLAGKIQSIFAELERELKDTAPSESAFKEHFGELRYKNSEQGRMLVKYVLSKINDHFSTTEEHLINFDQVNIEHILPRSPSKEWTLSQSEIKGYVNLLGNLTLLSKVINSRIQNGPIKQKLPELRKSTLAISKDLVTTLTEHDGQWGEDEITRRQERFADIAYEHIWNL